MREQKNDAHCAKSNEAVSVRQSALRALASTMGEGIAGCGSFLGGPTLWPLIRAPPVGILSRSVENVRLEEWRERGRERERRSENSSSGEAF